MPQHDFCSLYDQYPAVIIAMPETFTSHEFILELARRNQAAYIEALYSYRHKTHRGAPAPFLFVHRILSQKLRAYSHLVEYVRADAPSKDIFLNANNCVQLRKV